MSTPQHLRAFVNERLTAAADEIFQFFERTIAKYEEDAWSSQQEIERLRGLLLDFVSDQKQDFSQLSPICKKEITAEQHPSEQEPSRAQRDAEPRPIKEEENQQEEEEEQVSECKDAAVLYLPHSSVWEKNEQTKLTLQPEAQKSESAEQLQESQETKTEQFMLPLTSTRSLQTLIQNDSVQGGREGERSAANFLSDQTQTEQNRTSIITSRESTELSHLNSAVSDYRCYVCSTSFSSNGRLINHAFRLHSKYAGVLCAVCGKTLESNESLKLHFESHKVSKCCQVCGKHYNSTTAMAEHMTRHTGVKPHRCHVCGKECGRKGDLKIHMRIHTGEKPFCCSYCCKSFTHSGHLKKHIRSHTGERPHQCEICGRGFLQSAHLKCHLWTHAQQC